MYNKLFIMVGLFIGLIGFGWTLSAQDTMVIELEFDTFIEEGAAEQDVFIMGEDGMAYRVTPDSPLSILDEMIYGLAEADDFVFDPFQLYDNPVGPYEIGEPLDMMMKEWLAARGVGTYTVDGDTATVDFAFYGLVPDGVYTLWCSTLTPPPDFNVLNEPCGAEDGTENIFTADAHGELSIQMSFPALPLPTETEIPVLAIAWHADGQTYGADPGPFSTGTFTHLHIPVIPSE